MLMFVYFQKMKIKIVCFKKTQEIKKYLNDNSIDFIEFKTKKLVNPKEIQQLKKLRSLMI